MDRKLAMRFHHAANALVISTIPADPEVAKFSWGANEEWVRTLEAYVALERLIELLHASSRPRRIPGVIDNAWIRLRWHVTNRVPVVEANDVTIEKLRQYSRELSEEETKTLGGGAE